MKGKNFISIACVFAYMVVFGHSAIAHEHHSLCLGGAETAAAGHGHHDPHHGSCELLDTYLAEDDEAADTLHPLSFLVPEQDFHIGAEVFSLPGRRTLFYHYVITEAPAIGPLSLRAPPAQPFLRVQAAELP